MRISWWRLANDLAKRSAFVFDRGCPTSTAWPETAAACRATRSTSPAPCAGNASPWDYADRGVETPGAAGCSGWMAPMTYSSTPTPPSRPPSAFRWGGRQRPSSALRGSVAPRGRPCSSRSTISLTHAPAPTSETDALRPGMDPMNRTHWAGPCGSSTLGGSSGLGTPLPTARGGEDAPYAVHTGPCGPPLRLMTRSEAQAWPAGLGRDGISSCGHQAGAPA